MRHLTTLALLATLCLATAAGAGQNVVVVLDNSGSMGEPMRNDPRQSRMDAAKRSLLAVLEQLPPETQVGMVALNGNWLPEEWVYPLGPVEPQRVKEAIFGLYPQGGTPLGACLKVGADTLLARRADEHYGTYRLLVVTDGEATDGHLVERHLPEILARGLWVDVIGVDMAQDHSLATQVHTYRRADDPDSLEQAIREVFAESTGTTGDTDESDFEVIAALPDGVASAALEALAESGNEPIGTGPSGAPVQDVNAPNAPFAPTAQSGGSRVATRTWTGFSLFGCCCWTALLMLVGFVVVAALLAKPRKKR